jgi:hypothetical protein
MKLFETPEMGPKFLRIGSKGIFEASRDHGKHIDQR